MTQKELAEKAGIDFFTLSKVETGATSNPTIETAMKIAAALGVSMNHLMKEK
ncbi:helix-turn-helix transcriptional regulator [Patescibacteria group bacterium]|nr:helix-turn-helix transcriptional regulator [Patescibacteria group bacterium]